jgi:hypothetical protein
MYLRIICSIVLSLSLFANSYAIEKNWQEIREMSSPTTIDRWSRLLHQFSGSQELAGIIVDYAQGMKEYTPSINYKPWQVNALLAKALSIQTGIPEEFYRNNPDFMNFVAANQLGRYQIVTLYEGQPYLQFSRDPNYEFNGPWELLKQRIDSGELAVDFNGKLMGKELTFVSKGNWELKSTQTPPLSAEMINQKFIEASEKLQQILADNSLILSETPPVTPPPVQPPETPVQPPTPPVQPPEPPVQPPEPPIQPPVTPVIPLPEPPPEPPPPSPPSEEQPPETPTETFNSLLDANYTITLTNRDVPPLSKADILYVFEGIKQAKIHAAGNYKTTVIERIPPSWFWSSEPGDISNQIMAQILVSFAKTRLGSSPVALDEAERVLLRQAANYLRGIFEKNYAILRERNENTIVEENNIVNMRLVAMAALTGQTLQGERATE